MEVAGTEGQTIPSADFLTKFQESSITQNKDGGYTVKFPWRQDHALLPTNFGIAERRTRSLARKLKQTPELLKIYGNIIHVAEQERRDLLRRYFYQWKCALHSSSCGSKGFFHKSNQNSL